MTRPFLPERPGIYCLRMRVIRARVVHHIMRNDVIQSGVALTMTRKEILLSSWKAFGGLVVAGDGDKL